MPRAARLVAAFALAALLLAACGDDPPAPVADATTTTGLGADELPDVLPVSFNGIRAIFQPVLEPLDLQLTRATVNDFESGTHLALYVVPTADPGGAQGYLDRVVPLLAALQPRLFDQFPELASFDVCQEPVQAGGRTDEFPLPVTLVLLDEASFTTVPDWSAASLADVVRASRHTSSGQFDVTPEIERLDDWTAAEDAAAAAPTGG